MNQKFRPANISSYDFLIKELVRLAWQDGVFHIKMDSHKDAVALKNKISRFMRSVEFHEPDSVLAFYCKRLVPVVREKVLVEVLHRDKAPPLWVMEADMLRARAGGKGSAKRKYNDEQRKKTAKS